MNGRSPQRPADQGVALLERALGYTLGSLAQVGDDHLARRTPCAGWNLAALLRHIDESLVTLTESAGGRLDPDVAAPSPIHDGEPLIAPAAQLRDRSSALLAAWAAPDSPGDVSIGDATLHGDVLAGAGALEVAVHGWDVARSISHEHRLPTALATDLLMLAAVVVTPAERPGRFGPAIPVPADSCPGDQLVAFLGRDPAVRVAP